MSVNVSKNGKRLIKVGSRTSALALNQTNLVMDLLNQKHCDIEFQLITMDTIGDLILDKELSKIGDKSLFTKELELALQEKVVDFVVHSLKDVPTALSHQFVLASVCARIDCEDAVVMREDSVYKGLRDLPDGSVVGTSSVRRVAQLSHKYPNLKFASVRGNLNTRLRKLDSASDKPEAGDQCRFEAIILARAGLERLGWQSRMSEVLDDDDCLYAVGQGALACECRADDPVTMRLLSSIHDEKSALTSLCERSLMRHLDGGCSTPIAVRSSLSRSGVLNLRALVMSVDGTERVQHELEVLLPEEDLETVLELCASNGLPKCKRSRPERLEISTDEVALARDGESIFTGLRVFPICEIGRVRMAASQMLGARLAGRLLADGARDILAAIKRTPGEVSGLSKPLEKNLTS